MPELPSLFILDTNVLVHLIRGDALWERLKKTHQLLLVDPKPIISVVTVGELQSLALQFKWGSDKIDQMEYCIGYFRRVSIDDPEIIRAYAAVDAHSQSRGRRFGKNDLWIAATASVLGAKLITTDTDFDSLDPLFLSRVWIDPTMGCT